MKTLVVGGAGYIGAHMVRALLDAGHAVVTLDDLSTGHRDAVLGGEFVPGSTADRPLLAALFGAHRFDAVLHFAALIQAGESVARPAAYYRNNVSHTLNLLDAMVEHHVRHLVFSSTAAIFGESGAAELIDEGHPKQPINPYGSSKWMVEQMLADYDRAYGLKSVSLRYFNAAGADPAGGLGERHDPETHLVPLVLQAASGRRPGITVNGTDYATPDGTCIRDYVHVTDLCEAHLLALQWLVDGDRSGAFNLGNGSGFSVLEVIDAAVRVTGRRFPVTRGARRPGDPARLVAEATLARQILSWAPRRSDLETILADAWRWEQAQK